MPAGDRWLHELKWDGVRLMVRVEAGRATLLNRRGVDWTDRFPAIAEAAQRLPARAVYMDGEAVAERHGVTSLLALQSALAEGRAQQAFVYAFDLLHIDGRDLRKMPLVERKGRLADMLQGLPRDFPIRYSEHLEGHGDFMLRQAVGMELEGIVSKRRDSPYRSGRGADWLKIKAHDRRSFVVAGYTPAASIPRAVGSLVLGWFDKGALTYVGRVGSRFTDDVARRLRDVLHPMRRDDSPFSHKRPAGGALWVEPRLVAEVAVGRWSADGRVQRAVFKGLREDKDVRESCGDYDDRADA